MIIRSKTLSKWLKANFSKEELKGIAFDVSAGYNGLTLYSDTVKLYDKFHDEIWELISQNTEEYGYESELDLIASWNISSRIFSDTTFKNALVWYAAEQIAKNMFKII